MSGNNSQLWNGGLVGGPPGVGGAATFPAMTYGELRFHAAKLPEAQGIDPDRIEYLLNARLQMILGHMRWKGLEVDSGFATVAAFGDGTISLTAGDTALTLTGGAFTADMDQRTIRPLGRYESYTFTFVDDSSGTLDRPYEGDTIAEAGYVLYVNKYALPADFGQPLDAINEHLPRPLQYMDQTELDRAAAVRTLVGEPQVYSPTSDAVDDQNQVTRGAELYPIPQFAAWLPFRYVRMVPRFDDTNTATPLLPWISPWAIIYGVQADLGNDKKELMYQEQLSAMIRADSAIRGPQRLHMAPAFTRHRLARVLGYRRMRLP